MAQYEVIVGNVGCIYRGEDAAKARAEFDAMVDISKANRGREGGESVDLFRDGEPIDEYIA